MMDDTMETGDKTGNQSGTTNNATTPNAPATVTNNLPPGTMQPPSPALTPLHPTPPADAPVAPGGSTSSAIPPGQGTPANPSTNENQQQKSINPVYHPADSHEEPVSYEEMDEKLNKHLNTFWNLSMQSLHPTKTKEDLTIEEYDIVKRTAWTNAVDALRGEYNRPERQQFEPFMEERERRIQAARGGHST